MLCVSHVEQVLQLPEYTNLDAVAEGVLKTW